MVLPLRKYFYWSAACHVAACLFLILSPYLPFNRFRLHQEKIVWVELPKGIGTTNAEIGAWLKKSAALPKTTIEEQKKALEKPKPVPKKPEMTYQKDKKKSPSPSEEEKRMKEALARMNKELAARKAVVPEAAQIPKPETLPGTMPFGIPTGSTIAPTDPEYVIYQAKIRQRIMDQWILPLKFTGPGLGLICKIVVRMNDRGEVIETHWEQQSGNPSFDLSAMRAIEKAVPLDPPPDRLKWEALNEGFLVEFNPALQPGR